MFIFTLQEHNSRKTVQMMTHATQKKREDEEHEITFSHKFAKRAADQAKREHEDHLKHFQVSHLNTDLNTDLTPTY